MTGRDEATIATTAKSALPIAVLGVVYGDIGTSPLYALRESFLSQDIAVTDDNVLGILSLVFWSLMLVISVKYARFIMHADNGGEGGILALASLAVPMHSRRGAAAVLVLLGLFGTALLYGDGMITPAISVLSAVEGLEVATPRFAGYVVPISIGILVGLFSIQRHGTAAVGRIFGPAMAVWFGFLAILGIEELAQEPRALAALNPLHGLDYLTSQPLTGFLSLGSIFLVVTGAEALYADMGHFDRRQITSGWFAVVLPALTLNYFGQGALLLGDPSAIENPFYEMIPRWALYPSVALAAVATVIASQALISGAFSLTTQALHLDFLPRVRVLHTSEHVEGQVYVPTVNWALMVATVGLVVGFGSSTALAGAYGVAVATTMVITTVLFGVVCRRRWGWGRGATVALVVGFLVIDGAFFAANLTKIPDGGWFPLLIGLALLIVMTTWRRGRELVADQIRQGLPLDTFVDSLAETKPQRVPGTAVYMAKTPGITPSPLLNTLRHNHVVHERVIVVTVVTEHAPRVLPAARDKILEMDEGFAQVILHYGFLERPDVPEALANIVHPSVGYDPTDTDFFVGRETIEATDRPGMALWRERLFARLARNAAAADQYFSLPPERTCEVGQHIDL